MKENEAHAVIADPRTLLLPDPESKPDVVGYMFMPIFVTASTLAAVLTAKYLRGRPLFSGIQQYALVPAAGAVATFIQYNVLNKRATEREAAIRHYIDLHPEDFPMPERRKIGELFGSWVPIR